MLKRIAGVCDSVLSQIRYNGFKLGNEEEIQIRAGGDKLVQEYSTYNFCE